MFNKYKSFLSNCAGGSAVLLNCMRSFLQFTELDFVDLYQMCQVQGWDNLTNILSTMTFQKSKKRTCTKEKPTAIHVVSNPSVRRKIDFYLEENSKAIENVTQNMSEMAVTDTPDERFHKDSCENFENYNNDDNSSNTVTLTEYCKKSEIKSCKQRKNKMKDYKDNLNRTKMAAVDQTTSVALGSVTKTKLHLKKPYDKQTTGHIAKNTNTSEENEKTDIKNNTNYIIKKDNDIKTNFVNDKLSETKIITVKGIYEAPGFLKTKKTISEVKSDSNTKINNILREEDFDVINPEKFLESFIGYNIYADGFDLAGFQEIFSNNFQPVEENYSLKNGFVTTKKKTCDVVDNVPSNDANCNDFSSQTDEETENSVTKICDKIPTIVESLSHGDTVPSNDFEYNDVTFEMMCTVFGMKRLMQNLLKRRVRVAKPDAFVVEHIDFLVTVIKRDKNGLNPVYYYGHNYAFLNSELAFSTLQHNTGLFLVKT
ncbi:hypothetical protein NQ315_013926 [Exocentrus adspersus]|uniref:Uncharacterized protein n=1 Tax=Exocentrus adspersus TaxID=1586481 RepID=A0AAV8VRU5_9CUCU|nr:hypothetical protein NQ315_013926 [Exocentrus adspersus]